jgi:tRNA-specific 2-thiouridylase
MKILLGMSGGVDSSVAAILLLQKGYEVTGLTIRTWSQNDDFENSRIPDYIIQAQKLASELNINHIVVDARIQFYDSVISYFKNEYLKGKTPNPCAKCNIIFKWKILNDYAYKYNCNAIATGHYANKKHINNKYYITKGIDNEKDQSFFLWGLSQDILTKAVFPLGNLTKSEVKNIAGKHGFKSLKQKKESTGICFVNDYKYQPFLKTILNKEKINIEQGKFIDTQGNFLANHNGYPYYTVGQRRGLGLNPENPFYVTKINPQKNIIELGHRQDLYKKKMIIENYNIIDKQDFNGNIITKIRYRKQEALSKIEFISDNLLRVVFNKPEWSIASGQTAVFYSNNMVLGGGFIVK